MAEPTQVAICSLPAGRCIHFAQLDIMAVYWGGGGGVTLFLVTPLYVRPCGGGGRYMAIM